MFKMFKASQVLAFPAAHAADHHCDSGKSFTEVGTETNTFESVDHLGILQLILVPPADLHSTAVSCNGKGQGEKLMRATVDPED